MLFDDGVTPRHILKNILLTGLRINLPFFVHHVAVVGSPFFTVICCDLQSLWSPLWFMSQHPKSYISLQPVPALLRIFQGVCLYLDIIDCWEARQIQILNKYNVFFFSTELSGLDLPDLTLGSAASSRKGLRRKRPRRSLNATDFEKRLGDVEGTVFVYRLVD